MKVSIIQVPYDSGHREERMGLGPGHIVQNGLLKILEAEGIDAMFSRIDSTTSPATEIKTTFELCRGLSGRVLKATREHRFPLVLFGNCNSALGTLAGVEPPNIGIIWFDAHGDFNTPETSSSGFLDGMGLATAVGLCWTSLAASIPNFKPISPANVLLIGGRDFDSKEQSLLEQHRVNIIRAETIRKTSLRETLEPALDALHTRVKRIYIHVDLDVLDPEETPANQFLVPDGLSTTQVKESIRLVGEHFEISACGVGAYAPEYDKQDKTLQAALSIILEIIRAAHCD